MAELNKFDWDSFDDAIDMGLKIAGLKRGSYDAMVRDAIESDAIEFQRKRSGGIGASQISAILTNRPDVSKIPELKLAIEELTAKIESSKTGRTLTAEKELDTKTRQLNAIINDTLPPGALELAKKVALERLTGFCEESDLGFDSPATRWGKKYEVEAIEALKESVQGLFLDFENTGENQKSFQLDDFEHFWATPDATVTFNYINGNSELIATIDIKCPFSRSNHFDNRVLLKDYDWDSFFKLHPEYAWQGVCQMIAAKVNEFWFVSYDPRYPEHLKERRLVKRVFRLRQADVDFLRARVEMFEAEVKRIMAL